MDYSLPFKAKNVKLCLENICKLIQNKKSFFKNKSKYDNIITALLNCEQRTEVTFISCLVGK